MLFDGDIRGLITQWESRMCNQTPDYKVAVSDCIYDLNSLMDKEFADEIFEQQLKEDAQYYQELEEIVKREGDYAA